ncbi:MAG: hypothetical protein GKS00_08480 [Alphaproteobacteria bacterium]|nr:hypothetical protein [Alphaproteobacteria bacterium]
MTQNNLAAALQTMGARAGGAEGLAALERAIDAYEAALEVYTRREMPADWAMTQMNLGKGLASLGKLESGSARLEAALVAFRNARAFYVDEAEDGRHAATFDGWIAEVEALIAARR